MKIEKKIVQAEKFVVDGKEFNTEQEAEDYVKDVKRRLGRVYCRVSIKPDLTEGRGYYDGIIVSSPSYMAENAIYQFLINKYGNPVSMVMGVSPMPTYIVGEKKRFNNIKDLDEFINKEYRVGTGSILKTKKLELFMIDESGKVV